MDSSSFKMFIGILFKILTSIVIIPLNKYIYSKYKFPNMLLTCIHFLCTFTGVFILNKCNVFQIKKLPILEMIPMALSFCGFVVLNNLSLEFNTVGVSQHLKVLTMPTVMILSYYLYKTSYSFRVKLAIFFVVCGIYANSYYDVKYNNLGIIMGLSGVITTSLYQIWIGEKQKQFQISSLQLLYYQAPLSAFILLIALPFFEKYENLVSLIDNSRSPTEWGLVILSGLVAFLFNWSVYWIIGSTSALTYNIIGNVKFLVVIIIGVVLFDGVPNIEQILSIILVFIGLVSYSIFRIRENEKEAASKIKK